MIHFFQSRFVFIAYTFQVKVFILCKLILTVSKNLNPKENVQKCNLEIIIVHYV